MTERNLLRPAAARPKPFAGVSTRHLSRSSTPRTTTPSTVSGCSTRFLPRDSEKLSRSGGGSKIRDAVKAPRKRCFLDLEADSTSDVDAGVDEGSSSSGGEAPSGRHLAKRRRRTAMSKCSGLDDAGMHASGVGSYLEDSTVKMPTKETYADAIVLFEKETPVDVLRSTDARVDTRMVEHAHYLFRKGFHVSVAEKFGAAFVDKHIIFGKHGSRKIPRFWKSLKGDRKRAPGRSRKPKTWPEVAALANLLALQGLYMEAVFLLTLWGGYLRPSDGMRLRRGDFIPPARQISSRWTLNLNPEATGYESKTGLQDECILWDDIEVEWMGPIFEAIRTSGSLEEEAWPFSYPQYCRAHRLGVKELGMEPFVPYQVRHSAPSWDRLHNRRSRSGVGKKGRWKSQSSIDRYEKSPMVMQAYRKYPSHKRAFFEECAGAIKEVMLRRRLPVPVPSGVRTTS